MGLMPLKNKEGKTDKDKNKLYVRYIDAETREVIHTSMQINPDELTDDDA